MSGQRLKSQFQRLYHHFSGQDSDTNLQDIAEVLFCTRRNVRMVINKMVDMGWIAWEPAVGRGKQSHLTFHSTDTELQLNHARKLVAEGKLEPALEALGNNADKLAQIIQEQLGHTTAHGKQIVRLPYYRAFSNLNPLQPLRRSEQHLVRQIFNGLTRINDEKEEVEGDLAHHWEEITPRHWRFYLRPSVRFHDGRLLESRDIIATFEKVRTHRLFNHIQRVEAPFANTIDIHLSMDDHRLPDLLTNLVAVIQPADVDSTDQNVLFPIGTGPYKVIQNDNKRFKLEAFEQYFGFRALIDMVDIWMLSEVASCYLQPASDVTQLGGVSASSRLKLDEGCNYLLFNRVSGLPVDPQWLAYLQGRLTALNILQRLNTDQIGDFRLTNAYGILPGWAHVPLISQPVTMPPAKRTLTIAFAGQHPVYPHVAQAIETILADDGIKLKILELTTTEIALGKHAGKIDIWLGGMSLMNYRDDALLAWFFNFDHIARAMPDEEFAALEAEVAHWRRNKHLPSPCQQLGAKLVEFGQILPLFHNWLGVDESGVVQGMQSNSMGWFDFKSVWMKPEHDLS
ncbi:HTH-type transcriptional regulator SgrR [Photobacterium aphoticum]|uniref:ABC transporter substrate-binding protein n=1 Tax=Photobacterium aphoticum TaxID=754436 RepID=A0A0J1GRQ7_9GAMM|nr:HTH-type transcriptional regulator SgrR [Photobacterium aphoticum]KLV02104.1 ABC transporter substrate-binding protein [Photobacterium aphoticum]PSU60359.1 HTH-type transcriptional regulator SgrR [Photobacterium aphoticum]GHA35209.1 transcriptional regulator [Photobacterium aphoticum]